MRVEHNRSLFPWEHNMWLASVQHNTPSHLSPFVGLERLAERMRALPSLTQLWNWFAFRSWFASFRLSETFSQRADYLWEDMLLTKKTHAFPQLLAGVPLARMGLLMRREYVPQSARSTPRV
jgi:hypothetical protein